MEGEGGGVSHCTLLLCCPTDTMVEELEPLCRNTSEQLLPYTLCVCIRVCAGA